MKTQRFTSKTDKSSILKKTIHFIFGFALFYTCTKVLILILIGDFGFVLNTVVANQEIAHIFIISFLVAIFISIYRWPQIDDKTVLVTWEWWPAKISFVLVVSIIWFVYLHGITYWISDAVIALGSTAVSYFVFYRKI